MNTFSEEILRDKVLGCWMGKNCGGTLGGPLEKCDSQEEPFNVDFYPEIREGGIPNDDLEMQLIWLRAVEEIGLDFTMDDMAEYWLDHVHYNFDEYGLTMTNLRLGLRPPVAGFYNNFFRDCMGCPIRTEIWACIAPGRPRVAARYAMIDSIVDHAGGESLYGALFNVAVESAAFVVSDPALLIKIGLSYIPEKSLTARCIQAAVQGHREGLDWKGSRRRVLDVGRHHNAQFSPPNIAFQVVGWLHGTDFGDAMCKAVNCGYDTDCTGATLGSFLGIVGGAKSLPGRWTAPLGEAIATSDPDGVKNIYLPPCPAPRGLGELTDRVLRIAKLVAARFGPIDMSALEADDEITRMVLAPPTRVSTRLSVRLDLDLDYKVTPQIGAKGKSEVEVIVRNGHPEPMPAVLKVEAPEGWSVSPDRIEMTVPALSAWTGSVIVGAPERGELANSNEVFFRLKPTRRPATPAVPLVFVGAPIWLRSPFFAGKGQAAGDLLDQSFAPETLSGSTEAEDARGSDWTLFEANGNDVGVGYTDFVEGVRYLRGFVRSPEARDVCLHVCSTVPAKVWLNNKQVFESKACRPLRPAPWGSPVSGLYGTIPFQEGWNEVLIKFAADAKTPKFGCHILYTDPKNRNRGIVDMDWAHFPWDKAGK